MCISSRGLPIHRIRWKAEKLFADRWTYRQTDRPEFPSIKSLLGNDLKIVDKLTNFTEKSRDISQVFYLHIIFIIVKRTLLASANS